MPSNQGSFRPVNVIAPKGSIFNPIFPAAAEARFSQCNRVIDLIYKALAPVLPNDVIAGSSASLSFCAYSGIRDSGDYWVFLEVNEGSYGGRPQSDGPDAIDNLMANTRNNPLEDLAMHLPMICDRYELRDDVMPGAGRHRGGFGVVKAQRMLTDGVITHENERHHDVPWGVFGGHPGAVGRVEIFNVATPDDIKHMPAKYSGIRFAAGDTQVFYGPCGGGFGDPLDRPAAKVLDDVLDDFCTVEHAREAYGVIVDLATETVNEQATGSLREQMRSRHRAAAAPASAIVKPAAEEERPAASGNGRAMPAPSPSVPTDPLEWLKATYGDDWSFDIVRHSTYGRTIEVIGEVRANGGMARETGTANGGNGATLGAQLDSAAADALTRCAAALRGRAGV